MTAPLVGLAAALTMTACGVPPTGVIEAGEPASGMFSPAPRATAPVVVSLYFLRDGDLAAYPRESEEPVDLGAVVGRLFNGPTASEAETATTALPRLKRAPDVTAGGDAVSVQLPDGLAPLSQPAMLQLACTVARASTSSATLPAEPEPEPDPGGASTAPPVEARRPPAHTSVHVLGDGWTMTQSADACPGLP
ncbi:hypothetical protein [Streptomyces wuyuanensis]|uniref:hypothetical protein n=1 Tax=Streptomyces wuyuanensis TaxID=1196353 RepID=UPI00341EC4A7